MSQNATVDERYVDPEKCAWLIRRACESADLVQKEIAKEFKADRSSLVRILGGKRTRYATRNRIVRAISDLLATKGLTIADLEDVRLPGVLARYQYSFDTLIADWTKDFLEGSRQFFFERVEQFLDNPGAQSGYLWLIGAPGVGKTAMLAEWVRQHPATIRHFNTCGQGINTPQHFIGNVCSQLIARYGIPREDVPPTFADDGLFFAQLLEAVAKRTETGRVVLVVDALDEVQQDSGSGAANTLFFPVALPKRTYIIVSSRPDALVTLRAASLKTYEFDPLGPDNERDVRRFLEAQLKRRAIAAWLRKNGSSEKEFVDTMWECSEGNFMYLHHVLPAIERHEWPGTGTNVLPHGLREYYRQHWAHMQRLVRGSAARKHVDVILTLATSLGPLSLRELAQGAGVTTREAQQLLRRWSAFVHAETDPAGTRRWRIYHRAFCDFLEEEIDPGFQRQHRKIASRALGKARRHPKR